MKMIMKQGGWRSPSLVVQQCLLDRHSQIHFTTRVISAVQVPAAGQSVGIISASTTSIVFTVMGMVRRIATTITMVQPTTMVLAFGGGVLALALNWATSA